ncbi:MAG: Gfo/Idh/MocA family oxidoreductase [Verrucomicrobia bacterium]|nr:Gfo/Idh/MocA family oxidoreductase [Verrucomicrobiota bacterium]
MSANPSPRSGSPFAGRRRCAIVGLGSRHELYQDGIEKTHAAHAQLVAVCDANAGRLELARRRSVQNGAAVPPGYAATDFERMLAETKPDTVIVTTTDSAHHDYIVRAMEAGCDVITEKPMTTDADKCRAILDTRRRTGRRCRVTFNYRYSPPRSQVKDILMSGEIGEVLSVDFHWLLNTHHGADYFRRWHSHKKNSGGLMVHKSTHHFDLVNWWLGAVPATVMATGERVFYTPAMARRLGLGGPHERCATCPEKSRCSFAMDLAANPGLKALYLDCEQHDGYFRDRCVFRGDIDIEDTMSVIVGYDNGVKLSYSLNAFNAWEGYTVAFNGTRGRLEHTIVESVYVNGTDTVQGGIADGGVSIRVIPLRGAARDVTPWTAVGDHGGGDRLMLEDIFLPQPAPDKYLRAADERAGAWSILVGIAANRSIATGAAQRISDLISGVPRPDYAPMPSRDQPLPMPPRV